MTVSMNVKQTLAIMMGIEATLRSYSETTQDASAKEIWKQQIPRAAYIVSQLQERIKTMEFQEPQYKGY